MKYQDVLQIIKDFEASSLTSLELEIEDIKVKMSKEVPHKQTPVYSKPEYIQDPFMETQKVEPIKGHDVKSPLVGTFFSASSPDAEPFIRVGDAVKKGDTLCIIEAMKIMNEITAPVSGTILAIKAKNGDAIGFDQVLVTIDDAE
ncbi:MAG: acetyl-CoA carboxylase biotin carboxyl carrier protein [Firmicutes bacterium]|nr:acetyl-CoA carboxylase biotin carboxyl carrier protein [Bacillota bacterium]